MSSAVKLEFIFVLFLEDKGGCKILYLHPSHCQSCWFLQLLHRVPKTLLEFIDIELHEAAKNRGLVRINFVTLGFAADIDLLSTTFGV